MLSIGRIQLSNLLVIVIFFALNLSSSCATSASLDYWDWYVYKPYWKNDPNLYQLKVIYGFNTCSKQAYLSLSTKDNCLQNGKGNDATLYALKASSEYMTYGSYHDHQAIYYIKPPKTIIHENNEYYHVTQLRLFQTEDDFKQYSQYWNKPINFQLIPGKIKVNFIVFTDAHGYPPLTSNNVEGEDGQTGWLKTAKLPSVFYQQKLSRLVNQQVITLQDYNHFNYELQSNIVYFTQHVAARLIEDLNHDFSQLSDKATFELAHFAYIQDASYWMLDGLEGRMDSAEALLLLKHSKMALDNHINVFVTNALNRRESPQIQQLGVTYLHQNFTDTQPPVILLNAMMQRRERNLSHEMAHVIGLAHIVDPGKPPTYSFQNSVCKTPITYTRLAAPNCENNILGTWFKPSCPPIQDYRPTYQLATPTYQALFQRIYACWLQENQIHHQAS